MRPTRSYVEYNPNNHEVVFVPVGEKVLTELDGKRVRVILTMETPEDFDRAEKVLASMRQIHSLQLSQ